MRFLGIDYGEKKIGLAISDESGKLAFPFVVLANNNRLIAEIAGVVEKEGVGAVVLGQSRNLTGLANPITEKIEKFKSELGQKITLPIFYEPEFFTSRQAGRTQEPDALLDARAAALILQSYLDRQNAHAL